ncbi:hypothetical protein SCHPADRAFT_948274 [Schizopora paradoxa]|uniref:Uncharacterized protein n=1 Tax=Schizopora paradoxa TaxID=27342 RepID=A0A0H2QW73_9AGAM|nr:hypothetical protein SCHPADRAFT_948274 [Schizopora paradoxa]
MLVVVDVDLPLQRQPPLLSRSPLLTSLGEHSTTFAFNGTRRPPRSIVSYLMGIHGVLVDFTLSCPRYYAFALVHGTRAPRCPASFSSALSYTCFVAHSTLVLLLAFPQLCISLYCRKPCI